MTENNHDQFSSLSCSQLQPTVYTLIMNDYVTNWIDWGFKMLLLLLGLALYIQQLQWFNTKQLWISTILIIVSILKITAYSYTLGSFIMDLDNEHIQYYEQSFAYCLQTSSQILFNYSLLYLAHYRYQKLCENKNKHVDRFVNIINPIVCFSLLAYNIAASQLKYCNEVITMYIKSYLLSLESCLIIYYTVILLFIFLFFKLYHEEMYPLLEEKEKYYTDVITLVVSISIIGRVCYDILQLAFPTVFFNWKTNTDYRSDQILKYYDKTLPKQFRENGFNGEDSLVFVQLLICDFIPRVLVAFTFQKSKAKVLEHQGESI